MGIIVYIFVFFYVIASVISYLLLMIILGIMGGKALLGVLIVNAGILISVYYILKALGGRKKNEIQ